MKGHAPVGGGPEILTMVASKQNKKIKKNVRKTRTTKSMGISKTANVRRRRGINGGAAQAQHMVKHGLNAFSTVHLPLPVATGSYHTIRTVRTINSTAFLTLLCPVRTEHGDWRTATAYSYANAADLLNAATVLQWAGENPFPGATGNDVECVPASFSVQATCTQPLLSAAGVTYIGRMKTGYNSPAPTDNRTSKNLADALLSYAPFRMVANAELVQKPKQVNAIPTNPTELAEFTPVIDDSDGTVNWAITNYGFAGFAPIVIYNPNGAALQLNVCTEWRVRLDPFNPMHASGKTHPPAPQPVWNAIMQAAESAGHGVEELAGVAAGGYALSQAGGMGSIMASAGEFFTGALPTIESLMPLLLL